jgi:hypothetical protein
MSKTSKIVMALGLVVFAAACAHQQEEVVVVEPEPITMEPVHTGKYK